MTETKAEPKPRLLTFEVGRNETKIVQNDTASDFELIGILQFWLDHIQKSKP